MRTLVTSRTTDLAALEQRLIEYGKTCGVLEEFRDKMRDALPKGELTLTGAIHVALVNNRSDLPTGRVSGHVPALHGDPLVMVEGIPQHQFVVAVEHITDFDAENVNYAWTFLMVIPETRGDHALVLVLECGQTGE